MTVLTEIPTPETSAPRPDIASVDRIPLDLSKIDGSGAFVTVRARGFKTLDRKLSWDALGIKLPSNLSIALRSPHVGLLPDSYRLPITRVSQQAYDALERWGLKLTILETMFGASGYRWVPYSAWGQFTTDFEAAQQNLEAALGAVEENWPQIEAVVVDDFRRIVYDAAQRIEAAGLAVPDDFSERWIARLEALLPTPERLRSRIALEYRVAVFDLASSSLEEQRRIVSERRRLAEEQEAAWLEEEGRRSKARLARAADEAEMERIRAEMRATEQMHAMQVAAQREIDGLKLKEAERRLNEALSPLDEGLQQLRAIVYEGVTAIKDSLTKSGYLRGTSAAKAQKLVEWVKVMNAVFGDHELAEKVAALEALSEAPGAGEKRDVARLEGALDDLKSLTSEAFRESLRPRRYDALEF